MRHIYFFLTLIFFSFSIYAIEVPEPTMEVVLDSIDNISCKGPATGAIFISTSSSLGNAYEVNGAGTELANGSYYPVDPDDRGHSTTGTTIYSNGNFFIYYYVEGAWFIDDNLYATNWNELYYWDETMSVSLGDAVWSNIPMTEGAEAKTKDSKTILKYSKTASNSFFTKSVETMPAMLGVDPAPTGYFLVDIFTVSGAGTPGVDGIYSAVNLQDKGHGEGNQVYSNGDFFVYFHFLAEMWVIDNNLYSNAWNEIYYFDENGSSDLENVSWSNTSVDIEQQPAAKITKSSYLKSAKTSPATTGAFNVGELEDGPLGLDPAPTSSFYFFDYSWTGPDGFTSAHQDLTNIYPGDYSLVVSVYDEPIATFGPVTIAEPEPVVINLEKIADASCVGSIDGEIDISVSGGDGPYSYQWMPAGNGQGFSGYYDPENWQVELNGGDGSVDITSSSIFIEGNDNGGYGIHTQATIIVTESGTFSFDWEYSTYDWGPNYDPAYYINGNLIKLSDDSGDDDQSGNVSFEAVAGDLIGFSVYSTDGIEGEAYLTVSNFTYPTTGIISTEEDLVSGAGSYLVAVTDANGCTTTSEAFTITNDDVVKPVAICKDITVYLDEEGKAAISSVDINNGSYDNCNLRFPLLDKKYFDCSNLGENTVTMTVNDFSGNFDYCAATVTIADSILPVITDMLDITVMAEANACTAVVEFEAPAATDNCSVTVEQTVGPASGSEFPAGSTLVTFVATDAAGNTAESSFTVTVEGVNVAPVIAPVAGVVAQAFATSVDVPLTGIGFGTDCLDQLVNSVTANASNTDLVNSANVAYVEGETTAVLTLSLPGGLSGASEITVTVADNGGTSNGGTDVAGTTFTLTVLENHAPETTIVLDTIFIDKNATLVKSLPVGLFTDPDDGDVLGCALATMDGAALPAWISLNEAAMEVSLSPTATELGEHKFVFMATDLLGASTSAEVVVVVQIPTGLAEFEGAFGLRVYPNPSKGKVYVSVENNSLGQIEISVHNMIGQEIHRKTYDLSAPVVLDLSGQPDGIYLVKLKSGMNEVTKKVILKK